MGMPPRDAFMQHMSIVSKRGIHRIFRRAAARGSIVRVAVQHSSIGNARFHSFNTTRAPPFYSRFFEKHLQVDICSSTHTIKAGFLGI